MVASNRGRQAARDPESRCDLPCRFRSARETHGTLYISSACRGIRGDCREAQPRPLMQVLKNIAHATTNVSALRLMHARATVLERRRSTGHCRLAPLFLSNTANIGPSDRVLPWLLSEGAYKFAALPPSRKGALGQFSPSRNRRAKASNDTSPREIANMTLPSAPTPTPVRTLSDVLRRSKRGCRRPLITSIGPDCVASSARGRCLRNAPVSATAARSAET